MTGSKAVRFEGRDDDESLLIMDLRERYLGNVRNTMVQQWKVM